MNFIQIQQKLTYLKSYLRGGALDLVKHLSNEDANYIIALDFLKKEYLDSDTVVDSHIQKLLSLESPQFSDFEGMRKFFNSARASIYELRNFGYSALEDDTLGSKVISYILLEKLPSNFKNKLSFIIKSDHPTTTQLLEHYSEVIRSLQKTFSYTKRSHPIRNQRHHHSSKPKEEGGSNFKLSKPSTLQAFQTQTVATSAFLGKKPTQSDAFIKSNATFHRKCKLCQEQHSMLKCDKYTTSVKRRCRLKQLKLCESCSGNHSKQDCPALSGGGLSYPCKFCDSKTHISAVCTSTNAVSNTPEYTQTNLGIITNMTSSAANSLIPSISIIMTGSDPNACELVRCMIDPGSQSSYISEELRQRLHLPAGLPKRKFKIKTFAGTQEKTYEIAQCASYLNPSELTEGSFLVDKD